ncbi:MAG: glycosyltransferase [Microbacterium ginsengisoli]|nr:glycosyltransferase [Microbacterium ginsengisoli]
MKISHLVTYDSPDGAFGGPTRVAETQCEELAARGHDVTLWAAAPVETPAEIHVSGYVKRLYPARSVSKRLGFAGTYAPGLTRDLIAHRPEVLHVHLARDLVTLRGAAAAHRASLPFVVQPHGMIDRSSNLLAAPIDAVWTRPVLAAAHSTFCLTEQEERDIAEINPHARVARIRNGLSLNRDTAGFDDKENRVVFLARLHQRKRPQKFVEMALQVGRVCPDVKFALAGPDEGELDAVSALVERSGLADRFEIIGAVPPEETDTFLAKSRVYVLPSVGEVFPMTLIESFRVGTPSVVTNSLGIADDCIQYGAAEVTDGSASSMADAVIRILTDKQHAQALVRNALSYLSKELNIVDVAQQLEHSYVAAIQREDRR